MSVTFPELRFGEPLRHEALTVFPLFSVPKSDVEYRLAEAALADEFILVEELEQQARCQTSWWKTKVIYGSSFWRVKNSSVPSKNAFSTLRC